MSAVSRPGFVTHGWRLWSTRSLHPPALESARCSCELPALPGRGAGRVAWLGAEASGAEEPVQGLDEVLGMGQVRHVAGTNEDVVPNLREDGAQLLDDGGEHWRALVPFGEKGRLVESAEGSGVDGGKGIGVTGFSQEGLGIADEGRLHRLG